MDSDWNSIYTYIASCKTNEQKEFAFAISQEKKMSELLAEKCLQIVAARYARLAFFSELLLEQWIFTRQLASESYNRDIAAQTWATAINRSVISERPSPHAIVVH